MNPQFTTRLNSLRNAMKAKSFKGFIIPSGDPHLSEYIAPSDKHREYISGFSGSSGVSVVTETEAALWTDGRYYNQANLQLDPSLWKLMRDGEPQTPSITDWLISQVGKEGGAVGVQGTKISQYLGQMWKDSLSHEGINLIPIEEDIFDEFWEDKPKRPSSKIIIHPIEYSGRSTASKVDEIRQKMKEKNTNLLIIAALDEIAWLLNIRGSDIPFNPVVFSYILLTDEKIFWFVEKERVTEEILNFLDGQVIIDQYDNLFPFLKSYAESDSTYMIWMDANKCSLSLYNSVPSKKVYLDQSPISIPKAIKNEVEIKGFKECSVRDCAAIIEYFSTLEEKIINGEKINECEAADLLHSIRLNKELFVSESFETISSTGANGAIIHYKPEPETCSVIEKNSLYLCDSGSQYRDGTTDITRTIHFGEATQHEKQCYTRVLQGCISLSSAVFPHGTTGNTLDVIARYKLWQDGLDYLHGTGHGVGSYLNVHEGPTLISFRSSRYPSPLLPGMTVTIEPGYYSDGNFGIRLENDMIIVEAQTPFKFGGKSFYTFESLTWVPYQTKLIDASLLSKSEIEWVNRYNQTCWEKISPLLSGKSLEYLERECKPIVI